MPTRGAAEFPRRVGALLLGLATLYAIYAVGAYGTFEPGSPFAYRIVMILGMADFPLPLLTAPVVFAASVGHFDLRGEIGRDVRRRHWRTVAAVAVGALVVCAVGPTLFERALEALGALHPTRPREGLVADAHARAAAPVAVGLFVVVSAVSGAVVGYATAGLGPKARIFLRWTAGVAVFVSFCATLVGVAELIAMRGVLSPPWLALAPPAVPLLLTAALACHDSGRFAAAAMDRLGLSRRKPLDPNTLDAVVSTVIKGDDREGSPADQRMEVEMAALVSGIRRVAADAVTIDDAQVKRIVTNLTSGPPAAAGPSLISRRRKVRRWGLATAAFLGSWSCLSVGLLVLGGATIGMPTLISAAVSGSAGAGMTVFLSRRNLVSVSGAVTSG